MYVKNRGFDKAKINSRSKSYTSADTYSAISISHLQMAFYLLMLGYVLAVAGFVTNHVAPLQVK
jgi:hypothetical protein